MKKSSLCEVANCALAYQQGGCGAWLCFDGKNPSECPIAQKAQYRLLELENTEFDYGHDIDWGKGKEDYE